MTVKQKIEKLQKDVAFWQDKLNRSRKESLRSIRALHLQHAQRELAKLQ
jgi:dTDP-4-dehydrorhamnose 3,5-epimerase-like enzyme